MSFRNYLFSREVLLKCTLLALSLVFSFGVIEVLSRTILYKPIFGREYPKIETCYAPNDFLENMTLYEKNKRFGWTYYPISRFFEKRSSYDSWHLHTYDRFGFRNNYDSGGNKIFMLGDSFFRGRLASDRATIPFLLDRWMPGVGVKSFAVGGYSTINHLRVYNYFSDKIPHELVILGYYYLDVLENDKYFRKNKNRKNSYNNIYSAHAIARTHSYAYRILIKGYYRSRDYFLRNDPFNMELSPFPTGENRTRKLKFTEKILKKLIDSIEENNAELLIVNIPPVELVRGSDASQHNRTEIRKFINDQVKQIDFFRKSNNVSYLYPLEKLKKIRSKDGAIYGKEDHHLNEKGQKRMAEIIYKWGVSKGYFKESHPDFSQRYTRDYPEPKCPRE